MRRMWIVMLFAATAFAQVDRDWVRTWEDAQRARPASIASVARIAPVTERGTPLVVHGRVLRADGKAAANVLVFAYQTDAAGLYNAPGARGWRLRGWAKSDAQGRFEFRTIRPAPYPRGSTPAHIHITIEGAGIARRWANDVMFADDPLIDAKTRADALAVSTRGGTQHVDYTVRIAGTGKF